MSRSDATSLDTLAQALQHMRESLIRIEAWTRAHDERHSKDLEVAVVRAVELEGRMVRVETALGTRTAIGGLGLGATSIVALTAWLRDLLGK